MCPNAFIYKHTLNTPFNTLHAHDEGTAVFEHERRWRRVYACARKSISTQSKSFYDRAVGGRGAVEFGGCYPGTAEKKTNNRERNVRIIASGVSRKTAYAYDTGKNIKCDFYCYYIFFSGSTLIDGRLLFDGYHQKNDFCRKTLIARSRHAITAVMFSKRICFGHKYACYAIFFYTSQH